jgi:hypothetical protein
VFKLLKILVGTLGLAAFVWWGLTVPLGDHTLFGHLQAIASSKESRDLVRGTKEKVADLKNRVVHGEAHAAGAGGDRGRDKSPASQELTDVERRDLRRPLEAGRPRHSPSTHASN